MANTRIKDISTTTSSTNSDDYLAIDGATAGTRKITASTLGGNFDENVVVEFGGNKTTYASNFLRSENGSYYIDAYNVGGDIVFRTSVASALDTQSMIIDGSTGNVAIGTTSSSYPLTVAKTGDGTKVDITNTVDTNFRVSINSGAAQIGPSTSSNLELQTGGTTRFTIDSSGRVGQAGITPGSYHANADNLVLANDGLGGDAGLSIRSGTSDGGSIYFADGTTGDQRYRGYISYSHSSDALQFASAGAERFRATSDGCLGVGLSTVPSLHKLMVQPTDGVNFSVSNNGSALRLNAVNNDASANCAAEFTASSYNFIGGNLGVGGSPDVKFHINEASGLSKMRLQGGAAGADTFDIMQGVTGVTNEGLSIYDVNETATRLVIDSSGRLGVNQSSMSSYNSNANTLVVGGASGNEGMTIASGASSEGGIYFANGTTGTDPYNGALLYRHNTNRLDIFTDGAAKWYIDSTGSLISAVESQAIDLSGSNYAQLKLADGVNYALQIAEGSNPYVRFNTTNSAEKIEFYKNLYMSGNIEFGSGNGLDFSGTADGSGTMSSELLDDYEEGTWTPVIADAVSGGNTATPGTALGRYSKIGRIVQFSCVVGDIDTTGLTAGLGLYIQGLPFPGVAVASWKPMTVMMDTITFSGQVVGIIGQNESAIRFKQFASGGADSDVLVSAVTSGTSDIHIQGVYEVV